MIVPPYDGDFLIDLIAVDAKRSTRFARLRARAWCLGQDFNTWKPTSPLPVWRTPLTWLRQGAEGVVVLDWAQAYWEIPDNNLIAEGEHHGQQIRNAMKPDPWRGRVMVRRAEAA